MDNVVEFPRKREMTSEEAVKYLSQFTDIQSVQTLYNICSEKRGPRRIRRGRGYRYLQADLDAWIESRSTVIEANR